MKRTQELFEKIEGYLAGSLSHDEVMGFENEMDNDPALKLEVEKHRELYRVLGDKDTLDFKKKLQKITEEVRQEELKAPANTASGFSYWKIAATVILLIGVGGLAWNILNTSEDLSALYASYYEPYPVEDTTRGEEINELNSLLTDYTKGKYNKVIPDLEEAVKLSDSQQLSLYLGNSYLNTGKEKKAVLQFETINDTSKYYEDAKWYLALAHLKMGNTQKTREQLKDIIKYNGIYKEKAIELSDKLTE